MYGTKRINLAWLRSYLTNRIQYISITDDLETDTKNRRAQLGTITLPVVCE